MEVRKRRMHTVHASTDSGKQAQDTRKTEGKAGNKKDDVSDELRGSFWLTRIVFIRSLGFIYCKRLQLCTILIEINRCSVSGGIKSKWSITGQ